jgi:hypothetical protein
MDVLSWFNWSQYFNNILPSTPPSHKWPLCIYFHSIPINILDDFTLQTGPSRAHARDLSDRKLKQMT